MNELIERYKLIDIKLKLIFLLVLCAIIGFMSYEESIVPAQDAFEAAKNEAEKLDIEVASLSKSGQSVVAIEAELRKSDAEITNLLELLPDDAELDRVLGYFANAAKDTGVEIKEFNPGEEGGKPGPDNAPDLPFPGPGGADPGRKKEPLDKAPAPKALPVRTTKLKVVLEGSFPQVLTFFDKTLGLPRILKIDSYTMKTEQKDAKKLIADPRLTVEVNYVVYSQKLSGGMDDFAAAPSPGGLAKMEPPAGAPGASVVPGAPEAAAAPPAGLSAKPLGAKPDGE